MEFEWEKLECAPECFTERARVENGFLYRTYFSLSQGCSVSMVFVPSQEIMEENKELLEGVG